MKKYNLFVIDAAKIDIKEIRLHYKLIQKELGKRFTADLQNTLLSIERLPTAFAIRYENIRFANLDIFPFIIQFFIKDDKSIIVIAILYNGRDPEYLKSQSILRV